MIWFIDKALALVGLVVAAPLLAIAGVLIKWKSPGPVIYKAQRAGISGTAFDMYKLRTMHLGSERAGRITGGTDPRVFGVGRVLRSLKIDELPQLANVVRGQMSLVGPRPEDVTIVREHYDEFMLESLEVLPGITGPGSLDYFADEASIPGDPNLAEAYYLEELLPAKIACDLVYVRNRSFGYHCELIVRTFVGVVRLGWIFQRRVAWEREEAARILGERGNRAEAL